MARIEGSLHNLLRYAATAEKCMCLLIHMKRHRLKALGRFRRITIHVSFGGKIFGAVSRESSYGNTVMSRPYCLSVAGEDVCETP